MLEREFPERLIAEERQRRIHDSRLVPHKWVPLSVLIMAQGLLARADPDDAALILRLATDPRMKTVWKKLTRSQPAARNLSKWTALIDDGEAPYPDVGFDPVGVFFGHAYFLAHLGMRVRAGRATFADTGIMIGRIGALLLRAATKQLREFKDESVSCHIQHIEEAARFCDKKVAEAEKLKEALAPAYIKRDHGSPRARGYVRMLAAEAKHLFGEIGYGTIATVASVALEKEIKKPQVVRWCASLDKRGTSKSRQQQ